MSVKNDPEYQRSYWEKNKRRLREQRKAWYAKNRERILQEAASRRETEKETVRERKREAWQRQKGAANDRRREVYQKQPEMREKAVHGARAWREKNREKHRAASREWSARNKLAAQERLRKWVHNNPAKVRAIRIRRRAKMHGGGDVSTAAAIRLVAERNCAYCGDSFDPYSVPKRKTVDHVVPLCRGGTNADDNLLACCHRCNSQKGSLLLSEWVATGRAPSRVENVISSRSTGWTPVKPPDTGCLPEGSDPERPSET